MRYLEIFFIVIFFANYQINADLINEKILSADIGSTRVKAALLSRQMSFEDLKNVSVVVFPSENWLGSDIECFLNPYVNNSLAGRFLEPYHCIALSISCDLWRNTINLSRPNMPRNLKKCLTQQTEKTVYIENDMVAWTRGALYFQSLLKKKIAYPCLCISLGTGATAAIASSENDVTIIMLHLVNKDFNHLRTVVRKQTNKEPGYETSFISKSFFQWIKENHAEWDDIQIQVAFQERFNACLQDLKEFLYKRDFDVKTILIGGGNSRYLTKEKTKMSSSVDINLMNPEYFKQWQISPDLISLLGTVQMVSENLPASNQMPKLEDVYNISDAEKSQTCNLSFKKSGIKNESYSR